MRITNILIHIKKIFQHIYKIKIHSNIINNDMHSLLTIKHVIQLNNINHFLNVINQAFHQLLLIKHIFRQYIKLENKLQDKKKKKHIDIFNFNIIFIQQIQFGVNIHFSKKRNKIIEFRLKSLFTYRLRQSNKESPQFH